MSRPPRLALIAIALCCAVRAEGQAPPTQSGPAPRAHHTLIYDPVRQRVLLYGGSTAAGGGSIFDDVWELDAERWSPVPITSPRRSGVSMAFDPEIRRFVALGGYDGRSVNEVRTLEGATWRPFGVFPPGPASEPGFVYDSRRRRFITFGGSAGRGQAYGDTWVLKDSAWTKLDVPSPPARQAHAMVYDERRDRVVVFGGFALAAAGQPPTPLGDLWEFDGERWSKRDVAGPSPRSSVGAAFDSKRGQLIVFGGTDTGFLGDTWSWDGSTWRKLADSGPEPRAMGYLAYDTRRDRIILFGGRKGWPDGDLADTWEWDGTTWRKLSSGR